MKHPPCHQAFWATVIVFIVIAMTIPMAAIAAPSTIADLPDPTRRLGTTTSPSSNGSGQGLRLQSILYSGQRKSIVINGYLKYLGSTVNGGRIVDIRHNAVVINHNGRLQTLRLNTSKSVRQRGVRQ